MADQNITTSEQSQEDGSEPFYPFAEMIVRYDREPMKQHSPELDHAGALLNEAFATAQAISGLAEILHGSQINRECASPQVTPRQEDSLMSAISILASKLGDSLCFGADHMENLLKKNTKGGV